MILAVILVLIGGFVLYRGAREMRHVRRLRREGRQVTGTVIRHDRTNSATRKVVVSYTDEHGVAHEHVSSVSGTRPTIGIGEPVTMRYLPGDPASAYLDERRETVRSTLLVVIIGFGFTAAGIALAVKDG